jgi:hypothetical protein
MAGRTDPPYGLAHFREGTPLNGAASRRCLGGQSAGSSPQQRPRPQARRCLGGQCSGLAHQAGLIIDFAVERLLGWRPPRGDPLVLPP